MAELSGDRRLSEIFRQYGQLKKYNPGQLLIEKGQPAAYSCYLASGYARTFCINSAGDDITLFYIEPDNLICSESLLLDATVQVGVEAIAPAEMYLLPGLFKIGLNRTLIGPLRVNRRERKQRQIRPKIHHAAVVPAAGV